MIERILAHRRERGGEEAMTVTRAVASIAVVARPIVDAFLARTVGEITRGAARSVPRQSDALELPAKAALSGRLTPRAGCYGRIDVTRHCRRRRRVVQNTYAQRRDPSPPVEIRMNVDERLFSERFPRSWKYHPEWVLASARGGANALWLTEWLAETLDLRSEMRVLDLGCGAAMSSVFLRREFGVQVWATDLWFSASDNLKRARDAGVDDGVFPIHADARSLPFATDFFDAVVCIDSFVYYGTDDLYLNYLARFVKPGGLVAIAGAGLMQEIEGLVPTHLSAWWEPGLWCLHSAPWWRRHWEKSGVLDIERADTMPDGWQAWRAWQRMAAPDNATEIQALEADRGNYLGYVRVVGRRRLDARLDEPIVSFPSNYEKKPLLRNSE